MKMYIPREIKNKIDDLEDKAKDNKETYNYGKESKGRRNKGKL